MALERMLRIVGAIIFSLLSVSPPFFTALSVVLHWGFIIQLLLMLSVIAEVVVLTFAILQYSEE